MDGPRLELWRGPTDNDRSSARGSFELASPEESLGEGAPGPSSEQRWRDRGLDRLVHRLDHIYSDHDQLLAQVRVAAAGNNLFVDVTYHWSLTDALALLVSVVPSPGWDCTWPRVGVRFDLPRELRHASWFGTGPNESYPDTRQAARVGRFAADIDELNVAYSRPQETGHRRELRQLMISDGKAPAAIGHYTAERGAASSWFHVERVHAAAAGPRAPSLRAWSEGSCVPVHR